MNISATAKSTVKKVDSAEDYILFIEGLKKEIIRFLILLLLASVVFLFLRILLELLGSDPNSLFAGFIYLVSDIFLFPFFGIFPQFSETVHAGQPMVDIRAFIAIFCYIILDILAIIIVYVTASMFKTGKQVNEKIEKDTTVNPSEIEREVK